MRKSIIFHFSLFTLHLFAVAAPTANEDYVDRQDARTYTNAVTDAATYTDAATNGAVTAARSLANAAKTGAVAQANAYTDAATNGAVAAANAYTDAAVADAKPSDYDTVKATAESAVQSADLEPYCTIEAARQMTNGITAVTKATVTSWGFLESFTESDPNVPDWAKSPTPPEPGNYQVVSNKAMSAVQIESDPNVPDWAKSPTPPTVSDEYITGISEQNRTNHPYLSVSNGGIYIIIPE